MYSQKTSEPMERLKRITTISYPVFIFKMKFAQLLVKVSLYASIVLSARLLGKIDDIPQIDELYHEKNVHVVNGDNKASRFHVDLYQLDKNEAGVRHSALLDGNHYFQFENLKTGEYELIVDSYDFILSNSRFRVQVDEEADIVQVFEDYLASRSFNRSSIFNVTESTPLVLSVKEPKQFYESASGSIMDMVYNSPLGFIFKNRLYTIIFFICLSIMAAPTILQYINPELADMFREEPPKPAQQHIEQRGADPKQTAAIARPVAASGVRGPDTSARRRK
ncbi:hypothetical protein G9P44_000924 [Scheffersomyces stipitis]|nr:hypothetical protein G9P44_000924 [Scheffersomyces stipitis]